MKLVIKGNILAKQSFRFTRSGIKYQDKDVKFWEAQARQQLISQLPKYFKPYTSGVVFTYITIFFPMPKSFPKKLIQSVTDGATIYRIKKPDYDNILKAIMDCMKGIVFLDDAQIVRINDVEKRYGLIPSIEMELGEVKPEYCR